jgi:hypothetical protein
VTIKYKRVARGVYRVHKRLHIVWSVEGRRQERMLPPSMTVKAATLLRDDLRLGIRRQDRTAGPYGGVYVIPCPFGLYVGQATDCYRRNRDLIERGWVDWAIVREMPGSTHAERLQAETEVADEWASRGWPVITRNTSCKYPDLATKGYR